MKLTVKKPFAWAHQGIRIEHFEPGQVIDTEDEDLIAVSTKQKWAVKGEQTTLADAEPNTPRHPDESGEHAEGHTDSAAAE